MPALQWISLGIAAPILLFGIYHLCDKLMIICNQVQLINTFKYEIFKINQYVASIEKYCELKAIDDSWFYSLNDQQRRHMYQLRDYLGLDEIPDVNAVYIVKQVSERTLKILSSQLPILEEALGKLDIEKMRQLQQITKETEHSVAAFSKKQMDHIRSEISSSRELQALPRGKWSVFFDYVIKILEMIGVPLATKLIYHLIL